VCPSGRPSRSPPAPNSCRVIPVPIADRSFPAPLRSLNDGLGGLGVWFFCSRGGLLFFPNLHFRFLSFSGMCFLKSNLSPSSCSATPVPGLLPLEAEQNGLTL